MKNFIGCVVGLGLCALNAPGWAESAPVWTLQYLELGPTRPRVTDKDSALFSEAMIRYDDGMTLHVRCVNRYDESRFVVAETFLSLSNGGRPFLTAPPDITLRFSDGSEVEFGKLRYLGGDYGRGLPVGVIAQMLESDSVELSDAALGFDYTFSLIGLADALKEMQCFRTGSEP